MAATDVSIFNTSKRQQAIHQHYSHHFPSCSCDRVTESYQVTKWRVAGGGCCTKVTFNRVEAKRRSTMAWKCFYITDTKQKCFDWSWRCLNQPEKTNISVLQTIKAITVNCSCITLWIMAPWRKTHPSLLSVMVWCTVTVIRCTSGTNFWSGFHAAQSQLLALPLPAVILKSLTKNTGAIKSSTKCQTVKQHVVKNNHM